MQKVLFTLMPTSWRPVKEFKAFLTVLGLALGRAYEYLQKVLTESNPGTAVDTLPDWYKQLGIQYDHTQLLSNRQQQARQRWTATGGQSLDYLESQIQTAFPYVFLEKVSVSDINMCGIGECGELECEGYPSWVPPEFHDGTEPTALLWLRGELTSDQDLDRLVGLLERIAPGEMEPVFSLTILSDTETSECGVAVCGLAECGAE